MPIPVVTPVWLQSIPRLSAPPCLAPATGVAPPNPEIASHRKQISAAILEIGTRDISKPESSLVKHQKIMPAKRADR
jgi:hypothetical protein